MSLVEQIYESTADVGLLKNCLWCPSDGTIAQRHPVGFATPDDTMFDSLASTTDYQISYPASMFLGLAPRDTVEVDGVIYQVHSTRAVGDGLGMRTQLIRVQRRVQ